MVQPKNMGKPLILSENKLILPWRIEDTNGLQADFTNIIFPTLFQRKYKVNQTTKNFESEPERILENKKCTQETGNVSEFYTNYNISEWFCPDWLTDSFNEIGGLWDDNFVYYYELKIGYCPQASPFDTKLNCTSLANLNKYLLSDNPFLISLLYPKYSFDPNNIENPLQIQFINYYYYLSAELHKTDRIYFKFAKIKDDKGWIFSEIIEECVISFNRMLSDFSYFDTSFYYKEGVSSSIYNLNIYFERDYDQIYRSYMKFQSLCADVGGCLKIIISAFGFISFFYNINLRKNLMFEELFDFENSIDSNKNKDCILKKEENLLNAKKIEIKNSKFLRDPNMEFINSNERFIKENNNIFHNFKNFKILEKKKHSKSSQEKINKMNIDLLFIIKAYFCRKVIDKKDKLRLKIYDEIDNYINQRLDVNFYLKNVVKFEKFREMQLNEIQSLTFDYLEKEHILNFFEHNEVENFKNINSNNILKRKEEIKKEKIKNYFIERIKNDNMDSNDKFLIKILDWNLRKIILNDTKKQIKSNL